MISVTTGQIWQFTTDRKPLFVVERVVPLRSSVFLTLYGLSGHQKDKRRECDVMHLVSTATLIYSPSETFDLVTDIVFFCKTVWEKGFIAGSSLRGSNEQIIKRAWDESKLEEELAELLGPYR